MLRFSFEFLRLCEYSPIQLFCLIIETNWVFESRNCYSVCVIVISKSRESGCIIFLCVYLLKRSRGSVVGIATGYGLDDWGVGVRVPAGPRIFSTSSRLVVGSTQPLIQWVPGALSPRVKRSRREADHSPPTSAEGKNMWIHIFTPPYAVMA
jgi:hypothetical protein